MIKKNLVLSLIAVSTISSCLPIKEGYSKNINQKNYLEDVKSSLRTGKQNRVFNEKYGAFDNGIHRYISDDSGYINADPVNNTNFHSNNHYKDSTKDNLEKVVSVETKHTKNPYEHYDPRKIISKTYKDVGCIRKEHQIGVHLYYRYSGYEILNDVVIEQYSPFIDVDNIKARYSVTVTTESSATISFAEEYSYSVALEMAKSANISGDTITTGGEFKETKSVSFGYSYSFGKSISQTQSWVFTENAISTAKKIARENNDSCAKLSFGKKALVFKIKTDLYEAKDFWWNHADKIKGSDKTVYNYVVVDPYVSAIFVNDKFI